MQVARYGDPQKKMILCGISAYSALTQLFGDRIRTVNEKVGDVQNIAITYINIGTADFKIFVHPNMDSISGYNGHCVIVDADQLKIVYSIQKLEADGKKEYSTKTRFFETFGSDVSNYAGVVRTVCSLERSNANAFGLFRIV